MKGFRPKNQPGDSTVIALIIKRLTPAIERKDVYAISKELRECQERYGEKLFDVVWEKLITAHPWLEYEDFQEGLETENNANIAKLISHLGLRLEDHFRVIDKGLVLTKEAATKLTGLGFPGLSEGNENLDGIGICRSPFCHGLSEDISENYINKWAGASTIIDFALGWAPDEPPRPQAMNVLRECVVNANPAIDVDSLVERARYDDRALLKLASLVHDGIDFAEEAQP